LVRIPSKITINREGDTNAKLISGKTNHTFLLVGQNTLYCWGTKKLGRLGIIPNELRKKRSLKDYGYRRNGTFGKLEHSKNIVEYPTLYPNE